MEVLQQRLCDGPPHPLEPLLDWRLAPNVLEVGWSRGRGSLPPDHHHWLPSLLDGRHRVVGAVGGQGGGQATCLKVDAVVGNSLVTSVGVVKSGTVHLIILSLQEKKH